ncbi:hypothetical protein QEN19_001581 [Hanseniaspora menglaensis]
MLDSDEKFDNLKQIDLINRGHNSHKRNETEKYIDKNRWKNRTSSNELQEDFKDIFELNREAKNYNYFSSNDSDFTQNNDSKRLSNIINEFDQIAKRDTKKLLMGLEPSVASLPNVSGVSNNIGLSFTSEDDLLSLMNNTKHVTEKIKLLNIFDEDEESNFNQNHQQQHKIIITNEPDTDVQMVDDFNEDVFMVSANDDYKSSSSSASEDSVMLDLDVNNSNITVGNVLKSIINPTELGIQFAESVMQKKENNIQTLNDRDEISSKVVKNINHEKNDNYESLEKEKIEKIHRENVMSNREVDESDLAEEIYETESKEKYNSQKVRENGNVITINNHYYNYFNMDKPNHQQYYKGEQDLYFNRYDSEQSTSIKLPNPWSLKSTPQRKEMYDIITYCQISLNSGIYFLTILLLIIFIKTFTQDLANLFYQQKQQHLKDIAKCGQLFDMNKCHLGIPKMVDQCSQWQNCMIEDADKKFINKTRIFVKLLADLIGEALSAVGFLNCLSLFMLLYSCYFIMNIFFGYVRGKSYGRFQNSNTDINYNQEHKTKENYDKILPEKANNSTQKYESSNALVLSH